MTSLIDLLEDSPAPAYAVDGNGVIVHANAALCEWVSLGKEAVVGRRVAYHSQPGDTPAEALTGLCPPPGEEAPSSHGTLSTMGRDGRLRHRSARFSWLPKAAEQPRRAVIVVVDVQDMSPQELAATLAAEPSQDALHRHVRQFRRTHKEPAAAALLLGDSPAARRLRKQFELAVRSRADVVVIGPCSADIGALARAVHYAQQNAQAQFPMVDCRALVESEVLRIVEHALTGALRPESSLLLHELDQASVLTQQQLASLLGGRPPGLRLLATAGSFDALDESLQGQLGAARLDSPAISQRIADLPAMTQSFVEQANASREAQVGRVSPDAVDRLALYDWPHGAEQLGQAIQEACDACQASEVTPADLPSWLKQAAVAASLSPAKPQPVNLEEMLGHIEREAIRRALVAAGDNKAEAARLLGLTRQRFYRRLESLGLLSNGESRDE